MHLLELEVERLRNLAPMRIALPAGLTMVVGANAQGKTSLLEAIYLLANGRSFRTRRIAEAVCWDGGPLRVAGAVAAAHGVTKLAVLVDGEERSLSVNGSRVPLEQYLGNLDVVDLTASRMGVMHGAPAERRRFIDRGLIGLRPSNLRILGEYRRVLAQRNALLRRMRGTRSGSGWPAELDAWDERLSGAAARLHAARRSYTERLGRSVGGIAPVLFGLGAAPQLRYEPSPASTVAAPLEGLIEVFAGGLTRGRGRDVECGHTVEGPHRDDLAVELGEVDLLRFGSSGQVRGAVIALKLAKLTLLREDRGEAPLFLLDDFDTDLDDGRLAALTGFLRDGGFQAIVATSKETRFDSAAMSFMKLRMDQGVACTA